MPDKLLNLSNDIVFQELFGNPKIAKSQHIYYL